MLLKPRESRGPGKFPPAQPSFPVTPHQPVLGDQHRPQARRETCHDTGGRARPSRSRPARASPDTMRGNLALPVRGVGS